MSKYRGGLAKGFKPGWVRRPGAKGYNELVINGATATVQDSIRYQCHGFVIAEMRIVVERDLFLAIMG